MTTQGLALSNVSKRFGGVQALDAVDFVVPPGEVHCLAGENGCGKSTLIKIICGVHAPERGARIVIDGTHYSSLTPAQARAHGLQVIWQDLALFPELSVAENIAFEHNLGNLPRLVRKSRLRDAARRALAKLDLDFDVDQPLRRLSIAQRQLVAISRALVADARIVFMDEPTASLTRTEAEALFEIVRRLAGDGISVVFVSHRLSEVFAIAKRVTVLRDGKLVGAYDTSDIGHRELTELMTGQPLHAGSPALAAPDADVVLETRGLTRRGEYADVSFAVRRGEVLGLTGLLGAGRTELALSLFGMTRPDAGEVRLNGEPLRLRSNRDAVRAGISYVSEDRLSLGLVQPQSIADNLALPVLDRLTNRIGLLDVGRRIALANDWIGRLSVKVGHRDDPVTTLSGGNQQRIVIGKWLATAPAVLILDSPTVGVDVGARAGIFEIIRKLAADGMAILLISDEVPEVHANAHRVLHMRAGRIVSEHLPRSEPIIRLDEAVHA